MLIVKMDWGGGISFGNNDMGELQIHGNLIQLKMRDPYLCRNMVNRKAAGHCIHSITLPTHRLMDMPYNPNGSRSPLPRLCCRTSTNQAYTSTQSHILHTEHCQSSNEGTLSLLLCKPASSLKSRNILHKMLRLA
jgi:hypothetical protein